MKIFEGIARLLAVVLVGFVIAIAVRSTGACGSRSRSTCRVSAVHAVDAVTSGKAEVLKYWMQHTAPTGSPFESCSYDAAKEGVYQRGIKRARELGINPIDLDLGDMLDIIDACYPDNCPVDPDLDIAELSRCPPVEPLPGWPPKGVNPG